MVPRTEKGNPSVSKEFLQTYEHPEVKLIYEAESSTDLEKCLSDIILHQNYKGRITDFKQTASDSGGTRSGRLS